MGLIGEMFRHTPEGVEQNTNKTVSVPEYQKNKGTEGIIDDASDNMDGMKEQESVFKNLSEIL